MFFSFYVMYTAHTEIYPDWHTLALHDALPIWRGGLRRRMCRAARCRPPPSLPARRSCLLSRALTTPWAAVPAPGPWSDRGGGAIANDRSAAPGQGGAGMLRNLAAQIGRAHV